ncbi:MAG: orotidine-5'-phosphate decarboxylase [Patescibacteria group bacterium]
MTLLEKLRNAQEKTGSILCVGLDPVIAKFPPSLVSGFGDRLQPMFYEYLTRVIRKTAPHACAFKPNVAFYEAHGPAGIHALETICRFIRKEFPDHLLVVDGKRGDIGDTAKMYAQFYKLFDPDAVTVSPYLGPKTLEPFLEAGLGIFALCVTSNKDAAILQNMKVTVPDAIGDCDDRHIPVYEWVAEVLTRGKTIHGCTFERSSIWDGQLGLVTGATHPEELGNIRQRVGSDVPLLIPGIGKQQGDLAGTLRNNASGPALINASSSVCHASSEDNFDEAAGLAAETLNTQINDLRAQLATSSI